MTIGETTSQTAGKDANGDRGIRLTLVQYGRLARVGWFGTVHAIDVKYGDAVVVETMEGCWLGRVLRTGSIASQAKQQSERGIRGELLRIASVPDFDAAKRQAERGLGLRLRANDALTSRSLTQVVLDVDVAVDGRTAILQFAGLASVELGMLAVRLAEAENLGRVRWLSVVDSESAMPTVDQDAEKRRFSESIDTALQRIRSSDPKSLAATSAEERQVLGLMGAYPQKIRDQKTPVQLIQSSPLRTSRRWMVRAKITGGNLTPGQFRRLGTLAERLGNGSLRLTMRQGLQLHGIVPGSPAAVIAELENMAVTTRGSCGNSLRNVTCCPLPSDSEETLWARQLAARVANRWLPRAAWLEWAVQDEQEFLSRQIENHAVEHDAGYERGYLPHKWKIGVVAGSDNCINVLANDLGMRVRKGSEETALVDLFVGGSLAYRAGKGNLGSVPRLAQPLGTVFPDQVDAIVDALMELHREVTGEEPQNRSQRHFRRLKYVVERLGIEAIAAWVGRRTGIEWALPSIDIPAIDRWNQHSGWLRDSTGAFASGDWTLTIPVVGGRLRIADGWLRFAEFAQSLAVGPGHTLVLRGVADGNVVEVQKIAASLGVHVGAPGILPVLALPERVLTCVALPTCPLAIAESERDEMRWRLAANDIFGQLAELCSRSLNQCSLTQRLPGDLRVAVSGCSNGCSHPLGAELGIVAESTEQFRIFVGGNGVELGISVGVIEGPGWLAEFVRGLHRQYLAERNLDETGWEWLVRTF